MKAKLFLDDNDVVWRWDINTLRLKAIGDDTEGGGYLCYSERQAKDILVSGGYIENPDKERDIQPEDILLAELFDELSKFGLCESVYLINGYIKIFFSGGFYLKVPVTEIDYAWK